MYNKGGLNAKRGHTPYVYRRDPMNMVDVKMPVNLTTDRHTG